MNTDILCVLNSETYNIRNRIIKFELVSKSNEVKLIGYATDEFNMLCKTREREFSIKDIIKAHNKCKDAKDEDHINTVDTLINSCINSMVYTLQAH